MGNSWFYENGLQDMDLTARYINCASTTLLFALRTSHRPPSTTTEEAFVAFCVLLGACVNATIFGQVAHLIASMNAANAAYQLKLQSVNEHMMYHKIPKPLQKKILLYYESLWHRHRVTSGEELGTFTQGLSEPLRVEINMFLNKDLVSKVPMFRNVSPNVILKIVEYLHPEMYLPGDYIVRCGDLGDRMYFIRWGRCEVEIEDAYGKRGVKQLRDGD